MQIWFPANARRATTFTKYQKYTLKIACTKAFKPYPFEHKLKSIYKRKGKGKNIFFERLFQSVWKTVHQKKREQNQD